MGYGLVDATEGVGVVEKEEASASMVVLSSPHGYVFASGRLSSFFSQGWLIFSRLKGNLLVDSIIDLRTSLGSIGKRLMM